MNATVVPWYNSDNFIKVYEFLFSDDITNKKWAVDEISVWETRDSSLPSGVEATYLLTSAVIQDFLWTNESTISKLADLQAIYGSAITRFVSLCIDTSKSNEILRFCTSAHIAKSIGVPSYVVDIRNEWCHGRKPSLPSLRLAAMTALKYLKECYWEKEVASLLNYVKKPPDHDRKLFSLFESFIKFTVDVLKNRKTKLDRSDYGESEINKEYDVLLKKLEKYLRKDVQLFVKVLVSDGIFIPTDEDLKYMVSEAEYKLFVADSYQGGEKKNGDIDDDDDDDDGDNYVQLFAFENEHFPQPPEYHEFLWERVIKMLNKYDAVPDFMEQVLKIHGDRTVAGQKLLISWILKILRIHSGKHSVHSCKLKKIFRNKGIFPNWDSLFYSAVSNPCKYTMIILPMIVANASVKYNVKNKILGLLAIKLGFTQRSTQENFCKIFYTAEELESAIKDQKDDNEETSDSIWSVCPDKCHTLWPIGHIVNPVQDKADEKEEFKSIFKSGGLENDFKGRILPSNKNEDDDDDDHTSQRIKQPDFKKIISMIQDKETVLLKRPE